MTRIRIDAFKVPWWGCPGSAMSRPTYRVLDIDNGAARIRYCMIPGRKLGNYILPYWPVTSFLSIHDPPAEIAHQAQVHHRDPSGPKEDSLVVGDQSRSHRLSTDDPPWATFHLARGDYSIVLRVVNAGNPSPVHMEHYFRITEDSHAISVLARATNRTDAVLGQVRTVVRYEQDFNWGRLSEWRNGVYRPATRLASSDAFHAFSAGMGKGFDFASQENCELRYQLEGKGSWRVELSNPPVDLGAGESASLRYIIQTADGTPSAEAEMGGIPCRFDPESLDFSEIRPTALRGAPKASDRGTSIREIVERLNHPRVRGLNLRASFPGVLEDIQTLSDWGCNLLITGMGSSEEVGRIASKAHSLGMESLLQGTGSFMDGPPSFPGLMGRKLRNEERPDSFGQDEDHHYWYPVGSTRNFERDFGKSPSQATLEEKAIHLSRCFADKWKRLLQDVQSINPQAGVWFYTPTPGIMNIDPLDCYDVFVREASAIGDKLTVFPFYYGVDYAQVEYMVRRWKMGSAGRIVFLPMRDFMVKPSQFFRTVTAARRGGADGVCGFSFKVGESGPDESWQWKSVMMAAWANFPTPDLDAICLIEEPAELVEALGTSDIALIGSVPDHLVEELRTLLPGKITTHQRRSPKGPGSKLNIHVADTPASSGSRLGIPEGLPKRKGTITMKGKEVFLSGSTQGAVHKAVNLLLRFAELGFAEASI